MPLESLTGPSVFIDALDPSNPLDLDFEREGAAHLRGIKNVLQNSFPGVAAAVDLAAMAAAIAAIQADTAAIHATLNATRLAQIGLLGYFIDQPAQWIQADGSLLLKASYPELWTYASTRVVTQANFAANPGFYVNFDATQFRVPDLRARFIRGVGGSGPAAVGVAQVAAIAAHSHSFVTSVQQGTGAGSGLLASSGTGTTITSTMVSPGAETRPVNLALLACIFAGV